MGKAKKGPKKGMSDGKKKTEPQKVLNPFEVHVNRQKFQVLGRKLKTDRGLPGVARAKALKKRKATLLQEYKLKDKTNRFMDRRIGERNSAMTAEDKMTARFTAERMRAQSKKTMFNLADDEVLTHRGQTLNEIEKFDDPRSDDEEDEDNTFRSKGHLDADFVSDAHFGGGLFTRASEDGSKSRKDLIEQLIAESKKKKAEQQKLREQTVDLTEKLDSEWKDLLPVINAAPKASDVERPKPDSFDTLMRELKFEARGKPSDRLKSVDEVAREEKEKLEELESARLRRMQGITDTPASVPNHRSADDLDDNFAIDTDSDEEDGDEEMGQESSAEGSDQENDDDNDEGDEEVGDEDNNEEEADVDNSDSDEDDLDDLKYDSSDDEKTLNGINHNEQEEDGNDEEGGGRGKLMMTDSKNLEEFKPEQSFSPSTNQLSMVEKAAAIREDLRKRKELMEAARKELPYTYEVPESYEELQKVLAGRSPDYQGVIVERMIKCTHPSLNKDNKDKLAHLFRLLIQHLHDTAATDESENVCWAVLDRLVPSLFDITQWCPEKVAESLRHVLLEKQQEYRNRRKRFPGVETLIFLKLISLLFPTSDFRHPIVTPALVFMCQILSKCKLESRQDVARGLLVVSLFLEYTVLSKRFSPESVNFLRNLLYLATNLPSTQQVVSAIHLPQVRPIPPVTMLPPPALSLRPNASTKSCRKKEPNDQLSGSDLMGSDPIDDKFCINSLFVALRILSSMATQLSSQPACRHIFSPILPLLENLLEEKWLPPKVREEIENLQKILLSVNEKPLTFLVAAPKLPKLLKLYEPKIEQVYTDGKQRRPKSKEKQETEKLLHRVKREKKGALREIRKDRDFLTKIRLTQQLKSDAERRAKVKEIYGDASNQQGEMKKLERAKKRK